MSSNQQKTNNGCYAVRNSFSRERLLNLARLSAMAIFSLSFAAKGYCQSKPITIPEVSALKPGETMVGKNGDYSFYITSSKGIVSSFYAKNANNVKVPVSLSQVSRKNNGGIAITEECKACVEVQDESGTWKVRCYPIDCKDYDKLRTASFSGKPLMNYPVNPATGSYTVYKNEDYQIMATYSGKEITGYSVKSLRAETVEIILPTQSAGTTAKETVVCRVVIKRTLPDGSVITSNKEIPCDKLPKPKGANTN